MSASSIAKRLSHPQRDILIAHIVAPQRIYHRGDPAGKFRQHTVMALLKLGILKPLVVCGQKRAKVTVLTDFGREVAASILADYAEALVRAGALDDVKGLNLTLAQLGEIRLVTTSTPALTES